MGQYILRRVLTAIPTLFFISFVIFALLALSPGDPTANLPPSLPMEIKLRVREALGMNQPLPLRYVRWLQQFMVNEPLNAFEKATGIRIGDSENRLRITSWTARGKPVIDLIVERLPQTLWVVGLAYVIAVLIAVPLGVLSAYRQNSLFDQVASVIAVIGFSLPTFFTGVLVIQFFAVRLGWFPTLYNTTLRVTDWGTFVEQLRQMAMPVFVLAFFQIATISRFARSAVIENLRMDYVRTARAKGLTEKAVITRHVVRNSLIPVVTLVALGIPGIFGGAIVTEQIFAVNGIGQLLILSIQSNDLPVVQTVLVIFSVLVILFNLIADILYGVLDPRIRYS
ncbi:MULTISPECIES: ABC transporter permease [Caldilinea]|uniref:Putative peptide ABC transporter permease protein n=1 Tax=Caldilinea aerophila (strain DSM 14535 / JCM 11387 / NBRC 104270 / STL-6-O1) TaxID=926550 RepID=I0I388_CALAS|nr:MULTISPECIES: ABC transporter permease [Caldilinea]BAL99725.1 putative peptide ABC transporter permease protein [Caldilinea aerophila DSM 14535 = NBRC 104270]GIV73674.1 MAG: ABC transporter substrate-binding protein [Caldilinea sp.]